jgi:hypothetical protein
MCAVETLAGRRGGAYTGLMIRRLEAAVVLSASLVERLQMLSYLPSKAGQGNLLHCVTMPSFSLLHA